ncbi:MAG: FHA domain-containing protein [Limnoraphis robusta]
MITLILIHPTQPIPVNRWTFKEKSIIRIGRAKDNDIVIYNAVVSRHHLELWNRESSWEVVSFGTNGTYLNNQPLNQFFIKDGMVIRLGHSGPRLMVKLSSIGVNERVQSQIEEPTVISHVNPEVLVVQNPPEIQQQEVLEDEELNLEDDDDDDDNSTTTIEFLE